jgi:hypothetical protein
MRVPVSDRSMPLFAHRAQHLRVLRWVPGRRLLAVPSCEALRPSNQFRFPAYEVNFEKSLIAQVF